MKCMIVLITPEKGSDTNSAKFNTAAIVVSVANTYINAVLNLR